MVDNVLKALPLLGEWSFAGGMTVLGTMVEMEQG
jgi:hypothetical protein